jgi:hypothetical protein
VRLQFLERLEVVPEHRAAFRWVVVDRELQVAGPAYRVVADPGRQVALALDLPPRRQRAAHSAAAVVVRASAEVEQMQSAQSS